MMQVQFTVMGQPTAKGRPKFRIMQPKTEVVVDAVLKENHQTRTACIRAAVAATIRGAFVNTYTPSETVAYEERIAAHARIAMRKAGHTPTDRAVEVRMEFHMQIPTSWSKKKQAAALAGTVCATKKPDSDNIAKGILDACNGVCFVDDAQIVAMSLRKLYSANPRVVVAMRSLEGDPA